MHNLKLGQIATADFETDPFQYGREPRPFCCGFFDGEIYKDFWGDDCAQQFVDYLEKLIEPRTIYFHNGGKFDVYFLLEIGAAQKPIKIINGRIVSVMCGIHEIRDSYAIFPMGLGKFQKTEIDYSKMEADQRDKNRAEILEYLQSDCENLYEIVNVFINEYGNKLTIGSASLSTLRKMHPFEKISQSRDEMLRPFYFGGRVECFDSGVIKKKLKYYDVNSMYPYVMRSLDHPCGKHYAMRNYLPKEPYYFATIEATSAGALPVRNKNGSLSFPHGREIFHATGHEINTALELGLLEVHSVIECFDSLSTINFSKFVDTYSAKRREEKENNDPRELFTKLVMNSAYGKFAQNPERYFDYEILPLGELPDDYDDALAAGNPWQPCSGNRHFWIYKKPVTRYVYNDVGIAASITGAARSVLMRGLFNAKGAVYCDTDSIICEHLETDTHKSRLGAWDIEATGDEIAIAGKKLYCLFENGEPRKLASKGVQLSPEQVRRVAAGETMLHKKDAPSLGINGASFVARKIRKTV